LVFDLLPRLTEPFPKPAFRSFEELCALLREDVLVLPLQKTLEATLPFQSELPPLPSTPPKPLSPPPCVFRPISASIPSFFGHNFFPHVGPLLNLFRYFCVFPLGHARLGDPPCSSSSFFSLKIELVLPFPELFGRRCRRFLSFPPVLTLRTTRFYHQGVSILSEPTSLLFLSRWGSFSLLLEGAFVSPLLTSSGGKRCIFGNVGI